MKLNLKLWSLAVAVSVWSTADAMAQAKMVFVNGAWKPAYRENEVIVKYKEAKTRTLRDMTSLYSRLDVVKVRRYTGNFKNFEQLTFKNAHLSVEQAVEDLRKDPTVEYAQPNFMIYAFANTKKEVAPKGEPCVMPGIPYPPGCEDGGAQPGQPAPGNPGDGGGFPGMPGNPGDGGGDNGGFPGMPGNPGDGGGAPGGGGDGGSVPCIIPGIPYPPGCVDNGGGGGGGNPGGGTPESRPAVAPMPAEVVPAVADPDQAKAWGVNKVNAAGAWKKSRGSKDIIVAVIDTGIDYNHPDLAFNIWRNPNHSMFNHGVDASGDGISGDLVGWDFVHNDNLPFDDNEHGTHCAGVIGAVGGDGKGISGVNQRVSIMAVKFLSGEGSGDTASAIKAIDYAVSRGAKVLSNSWGGPAEGNDSDNALKEAIVRAGNAGVLFVAAAGNDGTNNDSKPTFPAAYNLDNMVTVAATTENDGMAFFSNTGSKSVHVGAPGTNVYSTIPGGKYAQLSGTSMACPHVAGEAALIWAAYPNATYREIKQRIMKFGDSLSALNGKTITGKRINVSAAIEGSL